jgi:putative ABC transport system substrate-binding protein
VNRRAFVIGLASVFGAPRSAHAQRPRAVPRVAFLAMGQHPAFGVFANALTALGWVPGRNVILEPHFAGIGKPEQFDDLAADVVRRRVDVIVALIHPEINAARRATSTIPIVMVIGVDPVGYGFARSLARPGGNVTGLTWDADPEFTAKSVEIVAEILPRLRRIGGIVDRGFRATTGQEVALRAATQRGITVQAIDVRAPNELENAFARVRETNADAVLVFGGSMLFGAREKIAQLGIKNRIPVAFLYREAVEAGGLVSYGPSLPDLWRRSAIYVDKLLRGARAAELPIEQPTKFELVINLKTAKALGLTIPPSLLGRADEVIQ